MPIRRRFCVVSELLLIKLLCRDNIDHRLDIANALNDLKNDSDPEVNEQAYESELRAITLYNETDDEYQMK